MRRLTLRRGVMADSALIAVGVAEGPIIGEANPRVHIPPLLSLYREGKLLLDETDTS